MSWSDAIRFENFEEISKSARQNFPLGITPCESDSRRNYFPIYYVETDEKFHFIKKVSLGREEKSGCGSVERRENWAAALAVPSSLNLQNSCSLFRNIIRPSSTPFAHTLTGSTCASNFKIALLCDFNVAFFFLIDVLRHLLRVREGKNVYDWVMLLRMRPEIVFRVKQRRQQIL